jgi:membrane protein implicated in regulation of membrane protease activity
MLLVLAGALIAAALRCSGLPREIQLVGFIVCGLFLTYLTWRWAAAWRRFDLWNEVQQHRAELEIWAQHRRTQLRQQPESSESLPPEA